MLAERLGRCPQFLRKGKPQASTILSVTLGCKIQQHTSTLPNCTLGQVFTSLCLGGTAEAVFPGPVPSFPLQDKEK